MANTRRNMHCGTRERDKSEQPSSHLGCSSPFCCNCKLGAPPGKWDRGWIKTLYRPAQAARLGTMPRVSMLVFAVQHIARNALQELVPITDTLIGWIEHNKLDDSVECKLIQEALIRAVSRGGMDIYELSYDEISPSARDRASTTVRRLGMLYCSAPDFYSPNVNSQSTAWLKRRWVDSSPPSILVYLVLHIDFASTGEAAPDQRRNPAVSVCHDMCELMDLYLDDRAHERMCYSCVRHDPLSIAKTRTRRFRISRLDRGSYEQQNGKIWEILGTYEDRGPRRLEPTSIVAQLHDWRVYLLVREADYAMSRFKPHAPGFNLGHQPPIWYSEFDDGFQSIEDDYKACVHRQTLLKASIIGKIIDAMALTHRNAPYHVRVPPESVSVLPRWTLLRYPRPPGARRPRPATRIAEELPIDQLFDIFRDDGGGL
ncbi:uncharacterized protein EV422DRAFT_503575 [Fimicolochytrium jonesii]|uniref:uncharacterized protein n=1 Tax=Fimicolochytrium jonesii TaxID=1396493 RepID=UPI0022FF40EC|nr:uncharacterized protein EV422DRAFT_503575 [Fimicolochytrium jonesii]KAI8826292.1 hypothetical protein EV422DRAFT_503575 [Fimicolochytrium jonesii]